MKTNNKFRRGLTTLAGLFLVAAMAFGQGVLKNGGTFTNTGTATYRTVENYKGAAAGLIRNAGTLNVSGTGTNNLVNHDGGGVNGILLNFIGGTSAGTLQVDDAITNNAAGARIDNDSLTYKGSIIVAGAISNTGGTFDTDSGRVEYTGTQTVLGTTYGYLIASTGGTKTVSSAVTVRDTFLVSTGATLTTSGAVTLTLQGAANIATGTFTPATLGTVDYNGDLNQSIIPAQYYTLLLSGGTAGRSKTSAGSLTFMASGTLNLSTTFDTLEVSTGTLDLTNLVNGTFTNTSGIRISSTTAPVFAAVTEELGNFIYNSASGQDVGAATYTNLTLRAAGSKTFPNGGTVNIAGAFATEGYGGTSVYTGSTVDFTGTNQTLAGLSGEAFNILNFSNSGTKTIPSGTFTAAASTVSGTALLANGGTFTVSGDLTIGATAALDNTNALEVNGDINNDGAITNSGTITVE